MNAISHERCGRGSLENFLLPKVIRPEVGECRKSSALKHEKTIGSSTEPKGFFDPCARKNCRNAEAGTISYALP